MELDRVQHSQKLQEYRKKIDNPNAEFPEYQKYLKYFVSLIVSLFMVILMKCILLKTLMINSVSI